MNRSFLTGLISVVIICLLSGSRSLHAQGSLGDQISIGGYQKALGSWYKLDFPDDSFLDLLLHNRVNAAWYPHANWTVNAQLRTRFFWGDLAGTPGYDVQIRDAADDYFRLGGNITTRNDYLLHSGFDRLNVRYSKERWDITAGRQRINWGMATVWNLNDIFNAYSFLDFDYEERPGTDAVRIQYYPDFQSSLELAVQIFDSWDEGSLAIKYKWNRWTYDFQALAGWAQGYYVAGVGWAGNLKDAGFKGESSLFLPSDPDDRLAIGISWNVDYSWQSGTYINGGYLYNSEGRPSASIAELLFFELSARNIFPYRHTIMGQVSHPITPLFTGSLTVFYSPGSSHALFINPFLTYSLLANLDLDLVGQLFFNRQNKAYKSPVQAVFLRIKYSY